MNEGFTLADFEKVIDIKTDEWKGTDNDKYIRPETLFGTKFESYLNQKEIYKGVNDYWPSRRKSGMARIIELHDQIMEENNKLADELDQKTMDENNKINNLTI